MKQGDDGKRFYDPYDPKGYDNWVESQKKMIEEYRKEGYEFKSFSLYPEKVESEWDC